MDSINYFLENVEMFDTQNNRYIETDFISGSGETKDYITFYLDECDEDKLATIIDLTNNSLPRYIHLLRQLILIRVVHYPDNKDDVFGIFDYSIAIDGMYCNQLLVVKTDFRGRLDHIMWES